MKTKAKGLEERDNSQTDSTINYFSDKNQQLLDDSLSFLKKQQISKDSMRLRVKEGS